MPGTQFVEQMCNLNGSNMKQPLSVRMVGIWPKHSEFSTFTLCNFAYICRNGTIATFGISATEMGTAMIRNHFDKVQPPLLVSSQLKRTPSIRGGFMTVTICCGCFGKKSFAAVLQSLSTPTVAYSNYREPRNSSTPGLRRFEAPHRTSEKSTLHAICFCGSITMGYISCARIERK